MSGFIGGGISFGAGTFAGEMAYAVGFQVETGSDSTDDPAVWVWAMLTDDEVEFAKRARLRSIISALVQEKAGSSMLVFSSKTHLPHRTAGVQADAGMNHRSVNTDSVTFTSTPAAP